jgi:hypothetical protein
MHKTKENSALPPKKDGFESRDAQETENEEHYEAVGGASSTDGVGPGYDSDGPDASDEERAEATGDGPLSGDVFDPPASESGNKKRNKGIQPADGRSNHAAENSLKSI